MKKRLGPSDRIYPMPCPIVVSGTTDDVAALAVAWIGIASATPPSVAMALRDSRHTLEKIRATNEFTVNIPSTKHAAEVDYCGLVSGHKSDKLADIGLTLDASAVVGTPMIHEFPYNLECRVTHMIDIGSYVLVVGEVVESHAEESILNDSGTMVDVDLLDPLMYMAGVKEYRGVGEKVADAFSIGKSLKPDTP